MKIDSVNGIGTIGYPFGEKKLPHFAQKQISDALKISILRSNKCCRNIEYFF